MTLPTTPKGATPGRPAPTESIASTSVSVAADASSAVTMEDFDELLRIQRQMASRVAQESDTDRKLQLMDVINGLVTDKNKKVQVAQVVIEAGLEGIPEEECERLIDELLDLGFLSQPEEGFLKRG